jgi:hypothetical protein
MDISREQALTLVQQLQQAHRLSAGFYQRVFVALDNLANTFDAQFWYWGPLCFSRPCSQYKWPGDNWSWDLLPMVTSTFVFVANADADSARPGCLLECQLLIDPAVLPEHREKNVRPDPANLPAVEPQLKVYLCWPKADAGADLKAAWEEVEYPSFATGESQDLGKGVQGTWLEVPLADFIVAPKQLEDRIRSVLALSIEQVQV